MSIIMVISLDDEKTGEKQKETRAEAYTSRVFIDGFADTYSLKVFSCR